MRRHDGGLISRLETRVLIAWLGLACAVAGFTALAAEAREGDIGAVDRVLLLAMRSSADPALGAGPRWVMESARDITALGGFTVLSLISILAVILLVARSRGAQATVFAGAVILAQIAAEGIKSLVGRPRPQLVSHLDLVYSSSFPSGHAVMSPVVYLTLATVLAAGTAGRLERTILLGAAILLVAAIGVSRVYLGVHWPTDVLAGWILGTVIALTASLILRRVRPAF